EALFPWEFFIAKRAPGGQATPIEMIAGDGKSQRPNLRSLEQDAAQREFSNDKRLRDSSHF
ncbi:MAG TPA: hypothetical protein VFI76_09130, partial [Terrimicrobiaceae bacterium]|nr:hypothetical protein [Terrimicrobiaceae bacterium]